LICCCRISGRRSIGGKGFKINSRKSQRYRDINQKYGNFSAARSRSDKNAYIQEILKQSANEMKDGLLEQGLQAPTAPDAAAMAARVKGQVLREL
jgi:hypothetical protein